MYLHGGFWVLAVATLSLGALSQVITITEYQSTCSAVYTTRTATEQAAYVARVAVEALEPKPVSRLQFKGLTHSILESSAVSIKEKRRSILTRASAPAGPTAWAGDRAASAM